MSDEEAQFAKFGRAVHDRLTVDSPFGALSKSELELAIFASMVEADLIDPEDRAFRLAKRLRCTPARARSIVFNYRLRYTRSDDLKEQLAAVVRVVKDGQAKEHKRVILNVEQQFWREVLIDELRNEEVFTDGSFNRERLVLDAGDFIKACDKVFGSDGKAIAKAVKSAGKTSPAEYVQTLIGKAALGGAGAAGSAATAPTLELLASLV